MAPRVGYSRQSRRPQHRTPFMGPMGEYKEFSPPKNEFNQNRRGRPWAGPSMENDRSPDPYRIRLLGLERMRAAMEERERARERMLRRLQAR